MTISDRHPPSGRVVDEEREHWLVKEYRKFATALEHEWYRNGANHLSDNAHQALETVDGVVHWLECLILASKGAQPVPWEDVYISSRFRLSLEGSDIENCKMSVYQRITRDYLSYHVFDVRHFRVCKW